MATGVVSLVSIVGTVLATAMLTAATRRAVPGRPVTSGEAWRDARPQPPRASRAGTPPTFTQGTPPTFAQVRRHP